MLKKSKELTAKDLKGRVVRGGLAKAGAQAVNFPLRIASMMVLARLLEPNDFGLVGMVTAFTGVFGLFKDAGLSMAAVQRPVITGEQISTLFWINVLVGAVLGLVALAMAPVLVSFYHEPRLFWVTAVLAVGFLFNGAGVQHSVLLQREMRFGTLAVIDIVAMLVSFGIAAAMAATGWGYWALVVMAVASPTVSTISVWVTAAWLPGRPRRKVGIRSMIRFGGTATLNGLVVYIAYNFEKVLLGRFWGASALGMYGRAYQLINIPTENLNSAVGGVAFSALSRLQGDPDRLKSYFLKGYSLVLALTLPVTIACGLFANDMILVFLGPKWSAATMIFRLLTPTVLIFALINPFGWLLYSVGLAGRSLKIALAIAPLTIAAYFAGLPHGPTGVAFAYSAAMTLWLVPHILWCIHGTNISPRDVLSVITRPLVSGIVAGAASLPVLFFSAQLPYPLARLALGCGVLFGIYLCMLLYVMGQKSFYLKLLGELRKRSPSDDKQPAGKAAMGA